MGSKTLSSSPTTDRRSLRCLRTGGERLHLKVMCAILSIMPFGSALQVAPDPAAIVAKAALAASARLGLTNRQLSAVIGASEASVSRMQRGRGVEPASKEGELALMFVRLFRSLDALVGGDDTKARAWLHAMNDHVGGVPVERIRTVEGLVDVVQYLDAMRGRL